MATLNVCVTGASGFIGQKLVQALSQRSHIVTVLSREQDRIFPSGTRVIIGDLTNDSYQLTRFIDGCDVLFHCAGEIHNPDMMRSLHVDATRRLIQSMKKRRASMHWVQLSSVGVYGPPQGKANQDRVVTENSSLFPKGEYETTKAEADELVINAAKDNAMTYSIVRPSNVFGERMPSNTLCALVNAVRKGLFFYIGKKGAVAPYIHVDDVVSVLVECGTRQEAKNEVFNVSHDCSFEEMIAAIAVKSGVNKPWVRLPEKVVRSIVEALSWIMTLPLTQDGVNALVSRTQFPTLKLEQKLGFKPKISVVNKLDEFVMRK